MSKCSLRPGVVLFLLSLTVAMSASAQQADEQNATDLSRVEVEARTFKDILADKQDYQMPEVDGTRITVTKKTSITKLEHIPTIVTNNPRQLFVRLPGVLVSEQQSPTQYNLSYRGIGNPQESEYVLVLQDGIPILSDWIGFPTLYYKPLPQGIAEVQLIRGGNSLIYGPQPAPVINFVSRRPTPGQPLEGYTEHVLGGDGFYGTYNAIQGTAGKWEFRAAAHYRKSDGARDNGDFDQRGIDGYIGYRPNEDQLWALDLHAQQVDGGNAGLLSLAQFERDPDTATTPFNRTWVDRYTLALHNETHFGDGWLFEGKLWTGFQDLSRRSARGFLPPQPPPASTTLESQLFRFAGTDLRLRKRWGEGNAFTFGTTLYRSEAPFREFDVADLEVDRYDRTGTPRLRQQREVEYAALFAENVFRLPHRIHIVPSVRVERENITIDESVRPPFLSRPLIDADVTRTVTLFGIGIGNDFGTGNETYFNISQGYRPVRFFDIASPFSNVVPGHVPDPSASLTYEAGVHGAPINGLYYDASLFWIDFENRIESRHINETDVINVNTGDTRHRGFEGGIHYDFLAAAHPNSTRHLVLFTNVSLLDAEFTASDNPEQIGKTPAYAPEYIFKAGVTWRADDRFKVALTGSSVGSQYWSDSNNPRGEGESFVPARIPSYTVFDFAADWNITQHLRLLGGVSNLTDERYYSRVFFNGLLEPANGRTWYAGLALEL